MVKIGNAELIDLTTATLLAEPTFLISNIDAFLVSSGSEPTSISTNKLFEHTGAAFKVYIGGGASAALDVSSTGITLIGNILSLIGAADTYIKTINNSTTPQFVAVWDDTPTAANGAILKYITSSQFGGGGVTINNNTDNYLVTATGTANTLDGESRLTYDQSSLFVSGNIIVDEGFGTITLSDNVSYFNNIEVNASSIFYDPATFYSKVSVQAELDANLINVSNLDGLGPSTGDFGVGSRIAYNWGKTGGPALTAGRVVYLNTATQWADTQANATGSSIGVLGVIDRNASSGSVLLTGVVKVSSSLSSATIGRPVYLSPTVAGGVTTSVPSSSGQIARVIGYVIAPSDNLVYFNPSPTWIEL
jgi:hypothetical protein